MDVSKLPEKFRDIPCELRRMKPGDEENFDDAVRFFQNQRWTIPVPVVIKVASVGSFFRKTTNPNQPIESEVNLATVFQSLETGASGIHFNATDEQGRRVGGAAAYHALVDPCRERFGSHFVADCNVLVGSSFEEQMAPVLERLAEVAPLGTLHPRRWVEAAAELMESNGCRPELIVHNSAEIELAHRYLITPGLIRRPYVWILLLGAPSIATRMHEYMPNPRAMMESLLMIVNRIREIAEDSFIIVCTAGRASSYLMTAAMLLGLHVRVGTEDTMWRYPHTDDVLADNAAAFEQARSIAQLLGRRVATGEEYRSMIGLPPLAD